MEPVRWGVLGTGMIATTRMMPAINDAPSASLAGVASRDLHRAREVAGALAATRSHGSYDDLLADPEIDVVYIALPNQLHFEWAARALEAGKSVLCEKPLCLSVDDVLRLLDVRDRTGRHIEEAFGFRNHPQWQVIDDLLRDGAIGRVTAVQGTIARQFLDPRDIRNDPAAGGGALYDMGSYAVSACNLVLRRSPLRVVAALERDPDFGIDRLSTALLDYGAAHASFTVATQSGTSSWGTHQQLSVLGSDGWLRCDFPYAHARPTRCHVYVGDTTSVGAFETSTHAFEPVSQYELQVERFSRHVRGDAVPSWPIEDALTTMRTIQGLFASAQTGAWEPLPPA